MSNGDMVRLMTDDELEKLFQKALFCGSLLAANCTSTECFTCRLPFCSDIKLWLRLDADSQN